MGDLHTKSAGDVCSQTEVVTLRARDVPRSEGPAPSERDPHLNITSAAYAKQSVDSPDSNQPFRTGEVRGPEAAVPRPPGGTAECLPALCGRGKTNTGERCGPTRPRMSTTGDNWSGVVMYSVLGCKSVWPGHMPWSTISVTLKDIILHNNLVVGCVKAYWMLRLCSLVVRNNHCVRTNCSQVLCVWGIALGHKFSRFQS